MNQTKGNFFGNSGFGCPRTRKERGGREQSAAAETETAVVALGSEEVVHLARGAGDLGRDVRPQAIASVVVGLGDVDIRVIGGDLLAPVAHGLGSLDRHLTPPAHCGH